MKYHYSIFVDANLVASSESQNGFDGYNSVWEANQAAEKVISKIPTRHCKVKIKPVGQDNYFFSFVFVVGILALVGFIVYQFWGTISQFLTFVLVVVGIFAIVIAAKKV